MNCCGALKRHYGDSKTRIFRPCRLHRRNKKSCRSDLAIKMSINSPRNTAAPEKRFTRFTSDTLSPVELTGNQFGDRLQDQKCSDNSGDDDNDDQGKNCADENFIASGGATRGVQMFANQVVISRVSGKPERENGTHDWNNSDDFIDQNIERHPAEQNLRNPTPDPINEDGD